MEKIRHKIMSNAYHKDRNCFKFCVIAHGDGENIYTKGKLIAVTLYEDEDEYEEYGWRNHDPAWNIEEIRNNLDEVDVPSRQTQGVGDRCLSRRQVRIKLYSISSGGSRGAQGCHAAPSPGV